MKNKKLFMKISVEDILARMAGIGLNFLVVNIFGRIKPEIIPIGYAVATVASIYLVVDGFLLLKKVYNTI